MKDRIRIERPVADDSFDGAGSGGWALVAEVAAEVIDALPSRAEKLSEGINIASRPSRVRIRRRKDITASMRVLIGRNVKAESGELEWQTERVTQIIAGPAKYGADATEIMVEDYSSAGNPS
ncbi:head-tail adaptor protein [Sphingomonas sp. R-74633]|uniref:phage head completion protein n=1 Tax=Sphingomonas sp. R-74633 TaxID=2751188 RepID=UPI00211DAB80|nr:head-tail adaptor protein [Sphingomonas sp. R-74633]